MTPSDLRNVPLEQLPLALAALHRSSSPSELVTVRLPTSAAADPQRSNDVIIGAGFTLDTADGQETSRRIEIRREWTLPDTVGPRMTLLVCGLNPSPSAADSGIGFFGGGNRFWPAAIAAGMVTKDRDSEHALESHGLGMTDIVKRTTRRAAELATVEYQLGLARLERTVMWLAPQSICFVGLAGWRAVRDRKARPGWQEQGLGGSDTYVMPSTSGLNASSSLADLTSHLLEASVGKR